ncbi:hypothetical protein D6855_09905 [Butyrivibrio sp. CB08]|uniref:hypothetical protein n=1 Tax=Butyrivibrio sp. CB08 TaxID=2364879 RepID=UPI000EA9A7C9|nr:hypothetical protein [Butyrivibrio sp. CB08]RKM59211.1 hypothetical protein D6855_09905 [Butyrivibrio sp. CB08]
MKNSTKVLIIIATAMVMTLSLFAGYKFITHISPEVKKEFDVYTNPITEQLQKEREQAKAKKEQEKEEEQAKDPEYYAFKGPQKRAYDGPKIYQAHGYLYNSDGKVVTDYRNEKGSNLRMTKNIDSSQAVFIDEDTNLILIDAELNAKTITDNCMLTGMCFDGGYLFYLRREGDMERAYIYDIENEKEHMIAEGNSFWSVCISPDGQTLVYSFNKDRTQIHVKGITTPEEIHETENCKSIITISNDRETIFFSSYDKATEYYCLHKGKVTKLGKKSYDHDYLDRDCKQIIYEDDKDNIKYYRAGDKKPTTLVKGDSPKLILNNVAIQEQDLYMDDYVVDTDCFSDVMMITDNQKCYALTGKKPTAVEMTKEFDKTYIQEACVTSEGPACMFMKDGVVYKAIYDGKSVRQVPIYQCQSHVSEFVSSEDLTEVWVRDRKDIYYIPYGKEPVRVFEMPEGSELSTYDLDWDPLENRCYYIVDNILYSVGKSQDSKAVMENARFFAYASGELKLVNVYDMESNTYMVIGGEAYPYHY